MASAAPSAAPPPSAHEPLTLAAAADAAAEGQQQRGTRSFDLELPATGAGAAEAEGPPASVLTRVLALFFVASHLFFLFNIIWMCFFPPNFDDRPTLQDLSMARFVFTLVIAPMTFWETGKHWWRGTYFPLTSAESFYVLRKGREMTSDDMSPPEIRCGTLLSMIVLAMGFSFLAQLNFLLVAQLYMDSGCCREDYDSMSELEQWRVMAQFYVSMIVSLMKLKTMVLACVFFYVVFFCFHIFLICTCGYGCFLVIPFCCVGFDRNSKLACLSCSFFYDFVDWFYRRL